MKIEEFSVTSYGASPLFFSQPQKPGQFNLIYGPNEAGKSLLIDALLKLMLGEDARYQPAGTSNYAFEKMDRVSVDPEGFVRVKIGRDSYKLPEQGSLVDILNDSTGDDSKLENCNPADFRNIFVVRDSNLKFTEEIGSDYYSDLQDKLTGLHSKQIRNIRDQLQEAGRLTNSTADAGLSSRKDNNHAGERFEAAGECLKKIEAIKNEAQAEGYYQLEEKLQRTKWKIEKLEKKINLLKKARKRSDYNRGQKLLAELQEVRKKLNKYKNLNEDDYRRYRRAKDQIAQLEKERQNKREKIEDINNELEELAEPLARTERELNRLEEQVEVADTKLYTPRKKAESLEQNLAKARPVEPPLNWALAFFAAGTVFSLPTLYFQPTTYAWLYPLFFLLLLGGAGGWKGTIIATRRRHKALLQEINNVLADFGREGETLAEIKQQIEELKNQLEEKKNKYNNLKTKKKSLVRQEESLAEEVDKLESRLQEQEEIVDEIQEKSGGRDFEEYEKQLRKKTELQETISRIESKLQGQFTREEEEFSVDKIEQKLQDLAQYAGAAEEVDFDEQKLEEKKAKLKEQKEEKNELRDEYEQLADRLEEIERTTAEILAPEETEAPPCRDLSDLLEVEEKLNNFRHRIKIDMNSALEAIEVFEQLEVEEQKRVKKLFGDDSRVDNYFTEITGNRFEGVKYRPGEKKIVVIDKNEHILAPEQLSGGTFDQLYFAIRLGLGEKLLAANPGFFILDDPFIKADSKRLNRQVKMLRKIVEKDWQVLYFTAKQEVQRAVEKVFDNYRKINLEV